MKKLLSLVLCLLILLLPVLSLGEESYPAMGSGYVTDMADVLSDGTKADIAKLSENYKDAVGGKLYVVTRHFLGGTDKKAYATGLFHAWALEENDVMLFMVIGEEDYTLVLGDEAQHALPVSMQTDYLGKYFRSKYLSRDYDGAVGDLLTNAASYIALQKGKTLSVNGLFGLQSAATTVPQTSSGTGSTDDYLDKIWDGLFTSDYTYERNDARENNSYTYEDTTTGFSWVKAVFIICILAVVSRRIEKNKRGKNKGMFNFGHSPRRF